MEVPWKRTTYRLLITRRNGSEILLLPSGPQWTLPRIEVRPGCRLAEELTSEVSRSWGIDTYCLFVPDTGSEGPNAPEDRAILESTQSNERPPVGTHWMARTIAATRCDPQDSRAVVESLAELDAYASGERAGPFAKPGWLRNLFGWTQEQIGPLGLRVTGSFRQLNASPKFALLRLDAGQRAVWFKATGEPNAHELPITIELARLFPQYVPPVLGVHQDWNGWLSAEAEGLSLDKISDFSVWERIAEELAEFQVASIGKHLDLLEASCKDLRIPVLAQRIDPFVARMTELMAVQEKPAPPPLAPSEMAILGEELKDACALLQGCGLPDTVGHVDFNPGNILVTKDRCTFLDWAEGSVASPLLTFEYLREHTARNGIAQAAAGDRLLSAYLRPWKPLYALADLRRAAVLSPLIAAFAYGVVNDSWRSIDPNSNPRLAGFYRSLARRMYREAIEVAQRSESCLR
ncbi:MAG: hypothetical protein WBQ34_07310 [Candidatus Acidiferrales bacterium]